MHIGFIKLHRKLLDWEWYSDTNVMRVFTHLLLVAYYEPTKKSGRLYQAGQLSIGRKQLSKAVGLSEQQVRTALKKLENTQEITIKATSEYSIITLNNWNSYQQNNQQLTNDQPTTNQRLTTLKEVKKIRSKEVKNNNIYNEQFELFYFKYPLKKSKEAARKKFVLLISEGILLEDIMNGLEKYINDIKIKKTESKFIKHPSTWLNQGCWNDEYTQPKTLENLQENGYDF